MESLLLHTCCGPCSTVAVPAWRERGLEPVGWFHNPNIQPEAELGRRLEGLRRYARAAGLDLVVDEEPPAAGWREWLACLGQASPDERCARCLTLRIDAAARTAARLGFARFSTTLSVSPYQRHDLIRAAGETAAATHALDFVYLDLRGDYRASFAECRRLDLYRQPYCGCVPSKWEAWHERAARRRSRAAANAAPAGEERAAAAGKGAKPGAAAGAGS